MNLKTVKYTCPCCGYKTIDREPPGTFDRCSNCFWVDCQVQSKDPDYWGGANHGCLRQAQRNFIRYGVKEQRFLKILNEAVKDIYEKDPIWKPAWENEVSLDEKELAIIRIEGRVINGINESIHINDFVDVFTEFLESKGWDFGGYIKQVSDEYYRYNLKYFIFNRFDIEDVENYLVQNGIKPSRKKIKEKLNDYLQKGFLKITNDPNGQINFKDSSEEEVEDYLFVLTEEGKSNLKVIFN